MARPNRSTLTKEKVVDAAIAIIGDGGLEAFSMPKLATSLGVRAPSLYHYFADKDALLAAVARVVSTSHLDPSAIPPDADWTDVLVIQAVTMRRTIVAHPHCAPLLVRFMPRDNMFGEYEQACLFLTDAGVPAKWHVTIVDGLTALTIGAAILGENAAHYAEGGDGPTPDPEDRPALHTALSAIGGLNPDELFETFVRTYLDAIISQIADNPLEADQS
ncbi:TetR family transcriptional regulator [Mycolicibacterium sp.]|uniref:TetR family transcriptional regulator n=1 Tax=Mycolicibacterium sp. TaxID=2320850 RepID=UPI001A18A932|nr:TetR family transcriptional regulator [Mycolicibacterium sp.]MBJ7341255.1 TetR family transcriptional regulator [Mycolicibacterium sp.]